MKSLEQEHRRIRALHAHAWMGLAGSGAKGWTHPRRLEDSCRRARATGAHAWITIAIGARARMAHAWEAARDLIKGNRAWRFLRLIKPNFKLFLHGKDPRMLGEKER